MKRVCRKQGPNACVQGVTDDSRGRLDRAGMDRNPVLLNKKNFPITGFCQDNGGPRRVAAIRVFPMAFFDKGQEPANMERRFHRGRLLLQEVSALDDLDASALHLFDGAFNIPGLKIHPTARVFDKMCLYAEPGGIHRGKFNAVICRQAANEDFPSPIHPQPFFQARAATMTVVEEAAVTIHACIRAFLNHLYDSIPLQTGGEFRTMRSLNAMYRPQGLR